MGFLANLQKSQLVPSQTTVCLGVEWDPRTTILWLLSDKKHHICCQLQQVTMTDISAWLEWEGLMGSLNCAAEVVLAGHLLHQQLMLEGNNFFSVLPRDQLV